MRPWNWTGRVWLSEGVKALDMTPDWVKSLVDLAALDRVDDGRGSFCYLPLTAMLPTGAVQVVVCLYYKGRGQFQPGQASIHLRSEWDVSKNPL